MRKIGRNEKCPCRSGKKYKHCCALQPERLHKRVSEQQSQEITLTDAVLKIQSSAAAKKMSFLEIGVFLLYSTIEGDAWLLEVTESDCVQLANNGNVLSLPFDERPENIELDWSHTYTISKKKLLITSYSTREVVQLLGAPTMEIQSASKRIIKKMSPTILNQVHLKE